MRRDVFHAGGRTEERKGAIMKLMLIGFAVVAIGIAASLLYVSRRNAAGRKLSAESNDSLPQDHEEDDSRIIKALPDELKAKILNALGELPSKLTPDWLLNDLMAGVCLGNAAEVQRFLDEFITISNGSLRRAASVGDFFDMKLMKPDKEIPAEYIVEEVVYSGLVRTKTGEVLLKAVVA